MSEIRYDSRDQPYYLMHGERVYIGRGKNGGGSGSDKNHVPSRSSRDRSPAPSGGSYPKENPESRGREKSRHGYSSGRYGSGSGGSDPGPLSKDYYRDGIPEPSKGSRFDREYKSYKDDDAYADGAKDNYDGYVGTAGHYPRRTRNASPGIYKGGPLETKDWHKSASSYADTVSSTARTASESRDKFAKDYIGYDDKRSAKGHKERTDNLSSRSRRFEKRRDEHDGYFD